MRWLWRWIFATNCDKPQSSWKFFPFTMCAWTWYVIVRENPLQLYVVTEEHSYFSVWFGFWDSIPRHRPECAQKSAANNWEQTHWWVRWRTSRIWGKYQRDIRRILYAYETASTKESSISNSGEEFRHLFSGNIWSFMRHQVCAMLNCGWLQDKTIDVESLMQKSCKHPYIIIIDDTDLNSTVRNVKYYVDVEHHLIPVCTRISFYKFAGECQRYNKWKKNCYYRFPPTGGSSMSWTYFSKSTRFSIWSTTHSSNRWCISWNGSSIIGRADTQK